MEKIKESMSGREIQTLLSSGNLNEREVRNALMDSDYKQDVWDAEAEYKEKKGKMLKQSLIY